jgi:hypothetical protein
MPSESSLDASSVTVFEKREGSCVLPALLLLTRPDFEKRGTGGLRGIKDVSILNP